MADRPRVVFVCVENSCRSQMAEALARMRSEGRVDVYSAGSRPSGVVNPKAIASLAELGYDLSTHPSKGLDALPSAEFAYAITMGCGDECPHVRARVREDWGIPDPKHLAPDAFREVREIIDAKVRDLLTRLGV